MRPAAPPWCFVAQPSHTMYLMLMGLRIQVRALVYFVLTLAVEAVFITSFQIRRGVRLDSRLYSSGISPDSCDLAD